MWSGLAREGVTKVSEGAYFAAKAAPCMIEMTEMLLRRLSKISRFTGEAVRSLGLVFNQSLLVDRPPALFAHTVEYLRLRACIHKEGRRMCRVGEPVNSLLSLT